jgi:aminocarboxymuconate-semialdehyde decarboxylase
MVSTALLITREIPTRYPKLKIINSHLGGGIPMILGRMDNQAGWEAPTMKEKPSVVAKKMWYDSVSHADRKALRMALSVYGDDKIVLGSDMPYVHYLDGNFEKNTDYIKEECTPGEVENILVKNTLSLVKKFL